MVALEGCIASWGLKRFVSPEANWLILRHFHLGAQILAFIAANSPVPVSTTPLEPRDIDDLKDELFVKHDLNLFNFVIRLNTALREAGVEMHAPERVDFSMIRDPGCAGRHAAGAAELPGPAKRHRAVHAAVPAHAHRQRLLARGQFAAAGRDHRHLRPSCWARQHLILVNNSHPLVPMSTLRAGYRLVLHGLSTEMLHSLLMEMKAAQEGGDPPAPIA